MLLRRRLGRLLGHTWIVFLVIMALIFYLATTHSVNTDPHLQYANDRRSNRIVNVEFEDIYKQTRDADKKWANLTASPVPPCIDEYQRAMRYHERWQWANLDVSRDSLYHDGPQVDLVLDALATAHIVYVDVMGHGATGSYEEGTSEKWIAMLEGGQKAVIKLNWATDEMGTMKPDAQCNIGFEMPTSEIAAFHLHRVVGFHNSVYVSGRKINILKEVIPAATPALLQTIRQTADGICFTGHYNIPKQTTTDRCIVGSIIEASVSYWIPRPLKLYTYPPQYMPFSTPNDKRWGSGLNNRTYCQALRKEQHPYEYDWYYHELFDFAVIDTLMHHYDSKHYVVYDDTRAKGLTVRLDHGRAFCGHDQDYEDVMLTPIRQCCTLKRSTYENIRVLFLEKGELSRRWKEAMSKDPLAPVMTDVWFPVVERRLKKIMDLIELCAKANKGLHNVLVNG